MHNPAIIVFAQVPPPEHGQSRMVAEMLRVLRETDGAPEILHVNARFSHSMDDIGERSLRKLILSFRFIVECLRIRMRIERPSLYYVPGPVKWSSVVRDWLVLSALRPWFSDLIFHWHAIGHGEWAHGSERLSLPGPAWVDQIARKISRTVLREPSVSIAVSRNSTKDARAISSRRISIIPNGIIDPWPDFDTTLAPARIARARMLAEQPSLPLRLLFLSRGNIEKGLLDALKGVGVWLNDAASGIRPVHFTLAGGMDPRAEGLAMDLIQELRVRHGKRFDYEILDFVGGAEKDACYEQADLFLAPSHWESFGLTVAEALAAGLPVVAAASDGVSGVLPPGYPYLSPVGNPNALATNIEKALAQICSTEFPVFMSALRGHFIEHYTHDFFARGIRATLMPQIPDGSAGVSLAPTNEKANERYQKPAISNQPSTIPDLRSQVSISIYLADQNPKLGRSLGISRMTEVVMEELETRNAIQFHALSSRSSIHPGEGSANQILPWNTRTVATRVLTDHFHPIFQLHRRPDVWYYPKGYLPALHAICTPSVVTIHDTIVQYYADHYPDWRTNFEYRYWAHMLRHTLTNADHILTVSQSSRQQILDFMKRHDIPEQEITVTYEPCLYESIPQPDAPKKNDYVLHLASREPHKRTAWLIDYWLEADHESLPKLHVVGTLPEELEEQVNANPRIVKLPFLDDAELQTQFMHARALVFPSEIEGFGLPAIEAYYLGTPVCFVKDTSVEEVLSVATQAGGFDLNEPASLTRALDEVLQLPAPEIHRIGLKLRETYAAAKVVDRMMAVFLKAATHDRR